MPRSIDPEEARMRQVLAENWTTLRRSELVSDSLVRRFSLDGPERGNRLVTRKLSNILVRIRAFCIKALFEDDFEQLEKLISYGIDVIKPVLNEDGSYYGSFLHYALLKTHHTAPLKVINLLVTSGAKVNRLDSNGDSALLLAIKNAQTKIVKYLLENGASVDVNVLFCAAFYEKFEIIKLLASGGYVNVNDIDTHGRHVLDFILLKRNLAAFCFILEIPEVSLSVEKIISIIQSVNQNDFADFLAPFCTFVVSSLQRAAWKSSSSIPLFH